MKSGVLRSLVLIAQLSGGSVWGWQGTQATVAARDQSCQISGQIFGADAIAHTLMVKSDSGDIVSLSYDNSTAFLRVPPGSKQHSDAPRISSQDLGVGDRVCVQLAQTGRLTASLVLVTLHADCCAVDAAELDRLQGHSVFGIVTALDPKIHRITVAESRAGSSVKLSVDADASVAYWIFPQASGHLEDAVRGSWGDLSIGKPIYVHGDKKDAAGTMFASLILTGGWRSFAGSIESIDALHGLVRLREIGTNKALAIHADFSHLYSVARPQGASSPPKHNLWSMSFGDLHSGDAVLVLGREEAGSDRIQALGLVTGFSSLGTIPVTPDEEAHWIFDAIGLGSK